MQLLESAKLVADLNAQTRVKTAGLIDGGVASHLAVILVGEDPDSLRYIDIKTRVGKESGVEVSVYHTEEDTPYAEVADTVRFLANDPEVHAIIVQLPLPESWTPAQQEELFTLIPSHKDVDALRGDWESEQYTGSTRANLTTPHQFFLPPMLVSVCLLLEAYEIKPAELETVIIGRGKLVGQPLETFFSKIGYKVRAVDEETENILAIAQSADLLIAGTGTPDLVTYQWVKPGAVVLDCACDVHRDSVDQVASAVAPSKGGLGPVTVSWLLRNTVEAAAAQSNQTSRNESEGAL